MTADDLSYEIDSILHPESDGETVFHFAPHPRLTTHHKLDTSYYDGPFAVRGDKAFEHLLQDESDPLLGTLESITVPFSLLGSAFQLFGDSLVEYHGRKRRWDLYRFYPPILMTAWAAFEAWVRISSEVFVAVVPSLPIPVRNALLEVRSVVKENGKIMERADRRPLLERYWLLLKYGCHLELDRGGPVWKSGARAEAVRNSFVHYDVSKAPSLTALDIWNHMEAVMLLFIAPSTLARRTLCFHQYDHYDTLVQLGALISDFEERPLHKGWPREAMIFHCPFDGVDANRYPFAVQRP